MNHVLEIVGASFAVLFVGVSLWTVGMLVYDAWIERWNEKFRNTEDLDTDELPTYKYADSDFRAFIETLYDESTPRFDYSKTATYVIGIAVMLTAVWTTIYVFAWILIHL